MEGADRAGSAPQDDIQQKELRLRIAVNRTLQKPPEIDPNQLIERSPVSAKSVKFGQKRIPGHSLPL